MLLEYHLTSPEACRIVKNTLIKKRLIGSLVGAVILSVWSFIAWAISPLHIDTFKHNPAQDTLLKVPDESGMETGVYGMSMADNRNVHGIDL